jgi:hypothetical protein
MVAQVDMVNEALQVLGTRTTVTAAQLAAAAAGNLALTNNEALQANIIYDRTRKRLLRTAPWNCAFATANMTFITSAPGTPENVSPATQLWQGGQPVPPYAYEYQYPIDCLFGAWITPQTATGFSGGVPITTAVTGGAPSFWQGPPVKFRVGVDQFFVVTGATVSTGGSGYAVGDQITVALQPNAAPVSNILTTAAPFNIGQPQGAAAVFSVATIGGGGAVATVTPVGTTLNINGVDTVTTGSYFYPNAVQPATQGSTTGAGTGATLTLTFTPGVFNQRVVYTNQEFAIFNYVRNVTDVNLFDDLFTEAFAKVLGASLCMALKGDKGAANLAIASANDAIGRARRGDGNEGFTVNDVVPDWVRIRGTNFTEDYSGPYNTGFDWGALWPGYT